MTTEMNPDRRDPKTGRKGTALLDVPSEGDLAFYRHLRQDVHVVRFLNPTANKPLHVGHLRNAAIGMAIVGTLRAGGSRAIRHCVVEDIGRFMFEAIAGFRHLEFDGRMPVGLRAKFDHIIGWYYQRFRQQSAKSAKSAKGAADGGRLRQPDAADLLMRQWLAGDEGARGAWQQVRTLTLLGQQETLRRLGIAPDYCDFESVEDEHTRAFVQDGLRLGIFTEGAGGQVVYRGGAGRPVELIDGLGLPVENLRLLTFLRRLYTDWPAGWINIIVAGNEWRDSMSRYPDILRALGVERSHTIYIPAFIGMVTMGGRKVASRSGHGILADDLLDRVESSRHVTRICQHSDGRLAPGDVARLIVGCYLLATPRRQHLEFSLEAVLDDSANPGWRIARAWAEMSARNDPGAARSRPGGPLGRECEDVLDDARRTLSFERVVSLLARVCDEWLRRPDGRDATPLMRDAEALLNGLGLADRDSSLDLFSLSPLTEAVHETR